MPLGACDAVGVMVVVNFFIDAVELCGAEDIDAEETIGALPLKLPDTGLGVDGAMSRLVDLPFLLEVVTAEVIAEDDVGAED